MKLIGLTGRAGAGKDTVADILCEAHGFVRIALADPLRDGLKAMFDLSDEQLHRRELKEAPIEWLGKSPRALLQTLGTEWGRSYVASDLWLKVATRRIERIMENPPYMHVCGIVVTDLRFDNEADWLRAKGGEVWCIKREGYLLEETAGLHCSERGIRLYPGERIVFNAGTIADLEETVATALGACH